MVGKLIKNSFNDKIGIIIKEDTEVIPSLFLVYYTYDNSKGYITQDDCEIIS